MLEIGCKSPGSHTNARFWQLRKKIVNCTTSELELDYCHQKVHVQDLSRVAERLKIDDLTKLGNFKRITEKFEIDGKSQASHRKAKF